MGFGANYACDGQIDMFSYLASISTNAEEKAKNGADNKQECTIKACGATQELCSCHCGADSCCQYCTNECENRCDYSLMQPKVFDRAKGKNDGLVNNPNYIGLAPGTWVDEDKLGNQLTFNQITGMVGKNIIIDLSTSSHKWYKVVQVEKIVQNGTQRRLVYYDGKQQRGLVNECYFSPDYKYSTTAFEIKNN